MINRLRSRRIGAHGVENIGPAQAKLTAAIVSMGLILNGCAALAPELAVAPEPAEAPAGEIASTPATPVQTVATVSSSTKPRETTTRVVRSSTNTMVAYSSAPYICSPSGFGRTASCWLRDAH